MIEKFETSERALMGIQEEARRIRELIDHVRDGSKKSELLRYYATLISLLVIKPSSLIICKCGKKIEHDTFIDEEEKTCIVAIP